MKPGNWIALIGIVVTSASTAGTHVYVGVIEDFFEVRYSDAPRQQISTPVVRVRMAFVKNEFGWWPINDAVDPPEKVALNVTFDGRVLGRIETRQHERGFARSGSDRFTLEILTPAEKVPRVATGDRKFYAGVGKLQSWPLLALSEPNARDPEHWKPTQLTLAENRLLLREFRRQVPKLRHCDEPEVAGDMIDYADQDMHIVGAYRSTDGSAIVGAQLDDKSGCNGYDDNVFFSYWYVLEKDGSIRLFGDQMTAMDAADLDGDGKSEWVFKGYRGCSSGYRLYINHFRTEINSW